MNTVSSKIFSYGHTWMSNINARANRNAGFLLDMYIGVFPIEPIAQFCVHANRCT